MKADINGITMAFTSTGEGPAILLIHGFPLNHRLWQPQAVALANAGYQVVTPDLRGFGETDAPEGPYSMNLFADDMIALLDHLGIEKAVVGGMSMGGYVLLNILERYPQRVAAAAFVVTRSDADNEAGKERRQALADEVMRNGSIVAANAFAAVLFADDTPTTRPAMVSEVKAWMQSNSPQGLAGALMAMRNRKDSTLLLPNFYSPAIVIGAGEDKAIPPENSRLLAANLPDSRLVVIPNAGHMVTLEQPEAVNAALQEFLDQVID
jgi:pimeloyl-ACP methyl ester carboxylesterase